MGASWGLICLLAWLLRFFPPAWAPTLTTTSHSHTLALPRKTLPADEAARSALLAAYRASIPSILASKIAVPDECFVLQYVPGVGELAHTASLSARFAGKPIADEEKRGATGKEYEYALRLPTFLSRIAGKYTLAGAAAAAAAATAAAAAAAAGSSSSSGAGSSAAAPQRTVLVMGEESSVIVTLLPPQKVEVDPWIEQAAREEDLVRQQVVGVLSLLVCKVLFHDCCLETDASDRWAAGGSPAVRSRNAAQAAPSANASAGPAGEAASDADASAAAPQLQPDGSTAAAGDGRPRSAKRQSRGGPAQVSAAGDCPFPAAATEGGGEATEVPGRKRGPHWSPLEMCPILMQGVIPSLLPRD